MTDRGIPHESLENGFLQPITEIGAGLSEGMEDGLQGDFSQIGVVFCHGVGLHQESQARADGALHKQFNVIFNHSKAKNSRIIKILSGLDKGLFCTGPVVSRFPLRQGVADDVITSGEMPISRQYSLN
jgi:hypothetical protein